MSDDMTIADDVIAKEFVGTDFGTTNYRKLVEHAVLKRLTGYYNGSTITHIIQRLGLVDKNNKPTKAGKRFAWNAFGNDEYER